MRIRGLLLAAWLTVSLAAAQNIEGDWHASLEVKDDAPLRLALHVTREKSGALKATLDSIDEAGSALPVDSMTVSGDTVKFEMKDTGGFFEGRIAAGGSSIALELSSIASARPPSRTHLATWPCSKKLCYCSTSDRILQVRNFLQHQGDFFKIIEQCLPHPPIVERRGWMVER